MSRSPTSSSREREDPPTSELGASTSIVSAASAGAVFADGPARVAVVTPAVEHEDGRKASSGGEGSSPDVLVPDAVLPRGGNFSFASGELLPPNFASEALLPPIPTKKRIPATDHSDGRGSPPPGPLLARALPLSPGPLKYLDQIFDLSPAAAVFWVMSQIGINSILVAALSRHCLRRLLQFPGVGQSVKNFVASKAGGAGFVAEAVVPAALNWAPTLTFLAYLMLQHVNPAKTSGQFRMDWVRHGPVFKLVSQYYPHTLLVDNGEKNKLYDAVRGEEQNPRVVNQISGRWSDRSRTPYFFCCHPHGVLALTMSVSFTESNGLESQLFPHLKPILVSTVPAPFYLPFGSEWSQTAGLVPNDKKTIVDNLKNGRSMSLYVGGADEALLSGGGKMRLVFM